MLVWVLKTLMSPTVIQGLYSAYTVSDLNQAHISADDSRMWISQEPQTLVAK